MNDGSRGGLVLGGTLGVLLGVTILTAHGHTEERGTTTRVDRFDTKNQRTGSAIVDEKTGRIDFFDTRGRREGYGTIDKGGRLDLFDARGNRKGSGQISPGSSRGKR